MPYRFRTTAGPAARALPRLAAAVLTVLAALAMLVPSAAPASAQAGPRWAPPARQMPLMPRAPELRGDWLSPRAQWFQGVERVTELPRERIAELRAEGERHPEGEYLQFVRFSDGPVPVVVWSDRNGDHRADLIELFRRGGLIVQLIDADYDGQANVMRVYDLGGALLREQRW